MRIEGFKATADIVGRRIQLNWVFRFEAGETLADVPVVRIRRKTGDFQYPAPVAPDPYLVYDSTTFPGAGTVISELPLEERRTADRRILKRVATVGRIVGGRVQEVLRRTQVTTLDTNDMPLTRVVQVLDIGDSIGGLEPNTRYYYQLFSPILPAQASPQPYRALVAPGETYGLSRTLYQMLPAIHHRHDTITRTPAPGAESIPEASPRAGQLRRFIDLFGTPLDLMRTSAEGLRGLHNIDDTHYALLPLLARWIGWNLSFDQAIPTQRHEIKYAPALYRLTGGIPGCITWVQQETSWRSRVKEFAHNVFTANRPEALNLWLRVRDAANPNVWTDIDEPHVLDHAFQGRPTGVTMADGTLMVFYHTYRMNRWGIWYASRAPGEAWVTGQPLMLEAGMHKNPSAVRRPNGQVWVFWAAYQEGRWSIQYRVRNAAGVWGAVQDFGNSAIERKDPCAVVDGNGRIWLFWMARMGTTWRLQYTRRQGNAWLADVDFPDAAGGAVAIDGQPFVVAFPTNAPQRQLWVFWARHEPTGTPGQTRRVLCMRSKSNLALNAAGWSAVTVRSSLPPTYHEADPVAFVNPTGTLELFFSSDRRQGWSIWHRTFDAVANAWSAPVQVTQNAYTQRHACPVLLGNETYLWYRSNRSPIYPVNDPRGITSVDFRYAGSTTPRMRNQEKIGLHRQFDDFQTYTYDAGPSGSRSEGDWYAHDTLGIYLEPDTMDVAAVVTGKTRVRQVLRDFLPATDRAVLIAPEDTYAEHVYDYDRPTLEVPRLIQSGYQDVYTSILGNTVLGDGLVFTDALI